jgi:hypothetical protein
VNRVAVAALITALVVPVVPGCSKPEPEPTSVREPAVSAPELEQVDYVDPLEAARAEARQRAEAGPDPSDANWREGFDRREPGTDPNAVAPQPTVADVGATPTAPLLEQPSAPALDIEPTITDPLPTIDGLPPRDPEAVAKRPPDAMPPDR